MDLKEAGGSAKDLINLALDRDQWWPVGNRVISLGFRRILRNS
jgi:hypothetical protein